MKILYMSLCLSLLVTSIVHAETVQKLSRHGRTAMTRDNVTHQSPNTTSVDEKTGEQRARLNNEWSKDQSDNLIKDRPKLLSNHGRTAMTKGKLKNQ